MRSTKHLREKQIQRLIFLYKEFLYSAGTVVLNSVDKPLTHVLLDVDVYLWIFVNEHDMCIFTSKHMCLFTLTHAQICRSRYLPL